MINYEMICKPLTVYVSDRAKLILVELWNCSTFVFLSQKVDW